MGKRSHRARELAYAQIFGGGLEARDVALRLRIPVGDFESEGDGFGVDAVGAADHRRVFELPCPAFEHFGETLQVAGDQRRGLLNEQRLRRIDHIVRGEAVVEPAGVRANDLGHGRGEGDDVMFDLGFNLEDAVNAEVGARVNGLGGFFRHDAGGGERFGRGDFDRQPGAEAVLVAPDASHLGPGIAWDHEGFSKRGTGDCKSGGRVRVVRGGPGRRSRPADAAACETGEDARRSTV